VWYVLLSGQLGEGGGPSAVRKVTLRSRSPPPIQLVGGPPPILTGLCTEQLRNQQRRIKCLRYAYDT
jgi:hypothetical protein